MQLIDYFYQIMTRKVRTETVDTEGGRDTEWTDGATFTGAITKASSNPIIQGDSSRLYDVYTLTVPRSETLSYHEVFADRDGNTYRVISNSAQTPADFTDLDMKQYTVERYEL